MRAPELLKKRRDRAIAIVLNVKEREVDPLLPASVRGEQASRLMRKAILDQINDFYDFALDIATTGEAMNYEFNPEVWERRINKIDENVAAILRELQDDGWP